MRKRFFSLAGMFLAISAFPPAWVLAQPCTTPPPGLVGWWPGDGNANDVVGTNNGTLFNGASFATGMVDSGFLLDGLDDYVAVPDAPNLHPTNITVMAWVRVDTLNTPGTSFYPWNVTYIVFKRTPQASNFEGYTLVQSRVTDSEHYFDFNIASAGGEQRGVGSSTMIKTGQFYHVAGTYDTHFLKIYLHLRHWGGKVGRGRLHARMAVDERFGLGLDRMVVFSVWACCERGPVVMSGRRINDDKAPSAPDRQVGASLGQSDSKGAVREEHAGGRAD